MHLQKLDGYRFDSLYHEHCSEQRFDGFHKGSIARLNQKKSLVLLAKMNDTFIPLLFWAMHDDIEIVLWSIAITLSILVLLFKVEGLNNSPEEDDNDDIQREYRIQDNNNNNIVFEDNSDVE